jgi:hypothetical protein
MKKQILIVEDEPKNPFSILLTGSHLGGSGSSSWPHLMEFPRHLELPSLFHPAPFYDLDWLPFPGISRSQELAIQTVAKTVWILWGNEPERLWELLRDWSTQGSVLKAACGKIIENGFSERRFTPMEAFHKVEGWLIERDELSRPKADTSLHPTAAANLIEFVIPAISKASLSDLAANWTAANVKKSGDGFSIAMEHIFFKNPAWVLKVFSQWARKKEKVYNHIIASTLSGIAFGNDYRLQLQNDAALERQLLALRAVCSEEDLRKTIQRLVKRLRDRRSKKRNESARQFKKRRNALSL